MIPNPEQQNSHFTTLGGSFKQPLFLINKQSLSLTGRVANPCPTPLQKGRKIIGDLFCGLNTMYCP